MTVSVAGAHRVKTPYVLNNLPNERCDGCGAAAKLRLSMADGRDLAFCGHHANANAGNILNLAARLVFHSEFNRSSFEKWIVPAW